MTPLSPLERRVLLGLTLDPERLMPREISHPGIGWASLRAAVGRHGVAPLVSRGLRALGRVETLPDAAATLRDHCHALYVQNLARNTHIFAELARVLEPLRRAGIPVILLKGAALARALFGDIGLRYMGDVDLLVPEDARAPALGVLQTLGYHLVPGAPADLRAQARREGFLVAGPGSASAELTAQLYERYHFHYYLERERQPFPLELHWHIVTPGRGVAIDDLWREARQVRVGATDALCLRPEHLLLHLSLHLAMDEYAQLWLARWVDVHMAVTKQPIDWTYLWSTADRHHAARALGVALDFARRVLGTPVPAPPHAVLGRLDRALVAVLGRPWTGGRPLPMPDRVPLHQTLTWTVLRRARWGEVPRRLYRRLASSPEANRRLPERYRGSELMNLLYVLQPSRLARIARRARGGRRSAPGAADAAIPEATRPT